MENYSFDNLYSRLDKSSDLISQYCNLVERYYAQDLGLKKFKQYPHDIFFNNSAFPVIIMEKNKVIAGAILYKRSLKDQVKLPIEIDTGIDLEKIIEENKLDCNKYFCEISRITVRPEYRDRRITQEILSLILAKAVKEQCEYMFATTLKHLARNFRIIYTKLGIDYKLLETVIPPSPIYEGLDMRLTYANFKSYNFNKLLENCHFKRIAAEMQGISSNDGINLITRKTYWV